MSAGKLKIASNFIASAPTGQLKDVVTDVKVLVGDDSVLTPAVVTGLRETYHHDKLHFAKAGGNNVIVSAQGQVRPGFYLDTKSNTAFEFNHDKQARG